MLCNRNGGKAREMQCGNGGKRAKCSVKMAEKCAKCSVETAEKRAKCSVKMVEKRAKCSVEMAEKRAKYSVENGGRLREMQYRKPATFVKHGTSTVSLSDDVKCTQEGNSHLRTSL